MATCSNCEKKRHDEWRHCPWCGERVRVNFPTDHDSITLAEAQKALGFIGEIVEGKNLCEIWEKVKRDHPKHIVFIESGYMWEFIYEDAVLMSEIFDWKTFKTKGGVTKTGFPMRGKRPIEELEQAGYAYLKLERPDREPHKRPYRCVTEVFPSRM